MWHTNFLCINVITVYPKNFHDSSDICPMGLMYSIKIRQISHRTFGPSHRKCPTCPMIFVNTVIITAGARASATFLMMHVDALVPSVITTMASCWLRAVSASLVHISFSSVTAYVMNLSVHSVHAHCTQSLQRNPQFVYCREWQKRHIH